MIIYNLICKCGKAFESWFLNSNEFDSLSKKKLIKCIYCESSAVKKTIMSPNLSGKSNKTSKKLPDSVQTVSKQYQTCVIKVSNKYLNSVKSVSPAEFSSHKQIHIHNSRCNDHNTSYNS